MHQLSVAGVAIFVGTLSAVATLVAGTACNLNRAKLSLYGFIAFAAGVAVVAVSAL